MPCWEAYDLIEEGIYGNGALPADRASQRRAWDAALRHALDAYYEGARVAVGRVAREKVAAHPDRPADALYATAYATATYAYSDEEIIVAVTEAFAEFGVELLASPSVWLPLIRHARYDQSATA